MEGSLSTTSASGTPPRRRKQPRIAGRRSWVVREKQNTAAWAAEWGRVVTHPKASRTAPLPTGIRRPVCHQSPWATSPGR